MLQLRCGRHDLIAHKLDHALVVDATSSARSARRVISVFGMVLPFVRAPRDVVRAFATAAWMIGRSINALRRDIA